MRTMLIFLTLVPFLSAAQDINGKWEGNYSWAFGMSHPEKVVVDINRYQDSLVSGSSHLYYSNGQYEHYTILGIYNAYDSTIYFVEDSTIAVDVGLLQITCKGAYSMKLSIKGNIMRFDGRWRHDTKAFIRMPSMRVFLEKKLPDTLPATARPKVPDPALERKGDIQKLIEIAEEEKDSIKIELLDNAQIDNDVVSVYLDDSLVLHKKKLTAEPQTFYLSLSANLDLCSIKLVAESMGSVPPCTALMVVSTRSNRYNVTLSSDFGNNGILKLFLKNE